ncbi:MAG: tyrosine-protein phosphatase [Armatimonadota bacterium]
MIDLHAHILPGLDDGAQTLEESVAMAELAVADGITAMVAAPHVYPGMYDATPEQIRAALDELQQLVEAAQLPLRLLPGAEVMVDERLPQRWRQREVMSLADRGEYLLVEFPATAVPMCAEQVLFELQTLGVRPIIAHPEKNGEVQHEPQLVASLARRGSLVQLDADSVGGDAPRRTRRCADRLLSEGVVNVIATDAHSLEDRPPVLSRALEHARRLVGEEAEALVCQTPARILGLEED